MPRKKPPVVIDDDNPEWTAEDFARAKHGDEIPEHIRAAFAVKPRGRPVGTTTSNKTQVTLRVDRDDLERLKATGPGWQTRMTSGLQALMDRTVQLRDQQLAYIAGLKEVGGLLRPDGTDATSALIRGAQAVVDRLQDAIDDGVKHYGLVVRRAGDPSMEAPRSGTDRNRAASPRA